MNEIDAAKIQAEALKEIAKAIVLLARVVEELKEKL